jgi:hypothetical protein
VVLPDSEYTPEEQEKLLDRVAEQVVRRRLQMPAALFLELHRPLRFLAGQGLLLASPLLGSLFGLEEVYKFSRMVEDPHTIDRLLERIEERSHEQQALGLERWALGGEAETQTSDASAQCPRPNA